MSDENKREHCCCFTGHREIPHAEYAAVKARLTETVKVLIKQGICYFAAGGARGFDTLAAQTVLALKHEHPHVCLILVLPCKDQTRGWNRADKEAYEAILTRADKTVWLSEHYYDGCMHVRNRRLVDNAAVCVCYLKYKTGGTAYTVRYAQEQNLTIFNVSL